MSAFLLDIFFNLTILEPMKKILVLCFLGLMIAACGRMSKPMAPEGSVYPETYIIKE